MSKMVRKPAVRRRLALFPRYFNASRRTKTLRRRPRRDRLRTRPVLFELSPPVISRLIRPAVVSAGPMRVSGRRRSTRFRGNEAPSGLEWANVSVAVSGIPVISHLRRTQQHPPLSGDGRRKKAYPSTGIRTRAGLVSTRTSTRSMPGGATAG